MIRSINKIKKEAAEQLTEVKMSMEAEKKSLRYQINMKIEENNYLRSSNLAMINRARRETSLAADEKFKEREAQAFKRFDEEKQVLIDELKSLQQFADDHNYLKEKFTLQLALVKFRYTIKIMRCREGQLEVPIRDITNELRQVVMGKQLQELDETKKQLEHTKEQHEMLRIKNANDIYKLHEVSERIKLLEKNVQEMQDENVNLSSQLSREREEIRALNLEIKSLKSSDKINKEIIEVLEMDKHGLKEQVEQLSKQLTLKDPDFLGAGDLRDKTSKLFIKRALQQLNQEKFESIRDIISEQSREIGTITEIRGIENELIQNAFDEEIQDLPKIPQLNAMIQTDKELFNNMDPNIPLSDITAYHKLNKLEAEVKRLRKLAGVDDNSYNHKMVEGTSEDSDGMTESPDTTTKAKKRKKSRIHSGKHSARHSNFSRKGTKISKGETPAGKQEPDKFPSNDQPIIEEVERDANRSESMDSESQDQNDYDETKHEYSLSFKTKTKLKKRVVSINRQSRVTKGLTQKEIEAEEEKIDRKTINKIFKLKDMNPDLFEKALEYLRIGARKKKVLYNMETKEQQMARLYPENQPKVFSRLWEEVDKRRKKLETMKRITDRRRSDQWMQKLKEVKKTVWARMLARGFNLDKENLALHSKSAYFKDITTDTHVIKFPRAQEINTNNSNISSGRLDTAKSEKSGLIINQANLGMINPNKIRESAFITDYLKHQVSSETREPSSKPQNYNNSTQTDIKGRIYDDIDDELLDEIIEMNVRHLDFTMSGLYVNQNELSDYDVFENHVPESHSNYSLMHNRRKSDQAGIDMVKTPFSSKQQFSKIGALSQRVSVYKKNSRLKNNVTTMPSTSHSKRKYQGQIDGISYKSNQRQSSTGKEVS